MRNLSGILGWPGKRVGACLVVSVIGTLMTMDVLRAETLPSPQSISDETIALVVPSAKLVDADLLVEVAIRQAKVRSCEKAQDLFGTVINLYETSFKEQPDTIEIIPARIGILSEVIAAQRRAGCVEAMKSTVERLIAVYQHGSLQYFVRDAELPAAFYTLVHEVDLGSLYWDMGERESARARLPSILSGVRTADWSPSHEFQSAAVLLARMGHNAEALEIISRHEKFYEAREEDSQKRDFWQRSVAMLAAVAEAQAEAGHKEAARATLRQAIEKARRMPVARLTEVYGEHIREIPKSGKHRKIGAGLVLQSVGIMRIVWHAARMGETDLALEAFELASPLADETRIPGTLIRALVRKGEMAAAQQLLDRMQCITGLIAQGLLDRQDWAGAIAADDAYDKASCCKRNCMFVEDVFSAELGKARTFVQGEARALAWARAQKRLHFKVIALLGVVDALLEQEPKAVPPGDKLK